MITTRVEMKRMAPSPRGLAQSLAQTQRAETGALVLDTMSGSSPITPECQHQQHIRRSQVKMLWRKHRAKLHERFPLQFSLTDSAMHADIWSERFTEAFGLVQGLTVAAGTMTLWSWQSQ